MDRPRLGHENGRACLRYDQDMGHNMAMKGHDTTGPRTWACDSARALPGGRGSRDTKNCIMAGGGFCVAIWLRYRLRYGESALRHGTGALRHARQYVLGRG